MRLSQFLLAAAANLASADGSLGQVPEGRGGNLQPRETKASTHDVAKGWTPRPTERPDALDRANALELVRRGEGWIRAKRQTSNTWLNEQTCGYTAGVSSVPFTCGGDDTCATNSDNVVACSSSGATTNPFFTVCLDYQASINGLCKSMGPKTGCCASSTAGACITYLWPGTEPRSMFRCRDEQAIVTMLNEPQFVIDDRTKSTSATSTSSSSSSSAAVSATTSAALPPSSSGSSNNTGAIVGGVVGGVAGVALIAGAIAFLLIRKRNKKTAGGSPQAYSAVAPADSSYQGGGGMAPSQAGYPPGVSPEMSHAGYFPPGSVGSTLGTGTAYMNHTPPPPPGMYDQQHSYYDPSKMGEHQQVPGHMSPPGVYAPYPGAPAPYPVPVQHYVSELDTTNAAGQQGNPVEMPVNSPAQR